MYIYQQKRQTVTEGGGLGRAFAIRSDLDLRTPFELPSHPIRTPFGYPSNPFLPCSVSTEWSDFGNLRASCSNPFLPCSVSTQWSDFGDVRASPSQTWIQT